MTIRSVTIERFKRLEQVSFDLSDVNILIGGNNSGKSTIIQAVHFAFTLFQSLSVSKKWPASTQKSSTISPSELIYIPSDDPYSLGSGGRLQEDESRAIVISFTFDDGEIIKLAIRKGRITNLLVAPQNVVYARSLSKLNAPYSVFSPGLAGISRTENYVSDGVLLRAIARGDANVVLRNILYRLKKKNEWVNFENDLSQIFPGRTIQVKFDETTDQFISIEIAEDGKQIPLDLAGTGFLQAVQILAYLHLFSPKLIILDEPDSHLHPNNQRLLCSLLTTIAIDRSVQVLVTTHSRHVLDTMYSDSKILWVQDGKVSEASPDDQVDLLLELGALDIKEKISAGKYKVIVLTEDRATSYLKILLKNSGFIEMDTAILPYNGVTSIHLLKPLVKQIKDLSSAHIIIHRDRDYLEPDEMESWKKEVRSIDAEPFITKHIDVEGYFCTKEYLKSNASFQLIDIDELLTKITESQEDEITENYVNGRVDIERKRGSIGKLNYGALAAEAGKKVAKEPLKFFKGKRAMARIRHILKDEHSTSFNIDPNSPHPVDDELVILSSKYFKITP